MKIPFFQQSQTADRRGAIVVLTAVLMAVMLGVVAFSVDLGYLAVIRTELQTAADAAALAAAGDLLDNRFEDAVSSSTMLAEARSAARRFAASNPVGGVACELADSDIALGRLDLTAGGAAALSTFDPSRFNAVKVRVRRTSELNGEVSLFFARVLGIHARSCEASATAAFCDNFRGFAPPAEGRSLAVLPLALDKQTWDALLAGAADDRWAWDEDARRISLGPDGIREVNLYPQGTGSPGNRGTVDIGNPNNSTQDISRQIRRGITAEDLSYLPGGKLELGPNGRLCLNGDTGMSAGIKDDLASVIGRPSVIPIFSCVAGNGNKAQYTIVQFAGVRIMAVSMTGKASDRYVMIQPARVRVENGIPASDDAQITDFIFSKSVWLVR